MNSESLIQPPEAESHARCVVCNDSTTLFSEVVRDDVSGQYHRCTRCGHLTGTTRRNSDIYGNGSYFEEIDSGASERCIRVERFVRLLSYLPGVRFSRKCDHILDYGCGQGTLVELLRSAGFNVSGYEPFVDVHASVKGVYDTLDAVRAEGRPFEFVTCIEVIEHMAHPRRWLDELRQLLVPGGYVFLSTGDFRPGFHGPDWDYLNPAAGHVSIFTARSLRALFEANGFFPLARVNEKMWLFRDGSQGAPRSFERALFALSNARVRRKLSRLARAMIRRTETSLLRPNL